MDDGAGGARGRDRQGPPGIALRASGKDGPQLIRSTGKRWTEAAEAAFLDCLGASCNVTASAQAAGFSKEVIYRHRRRDPAFAARWQAALEQGYVRIEMLLVRRAEQVLEGVVADPDTPLHDMTSVTGRSPEAWAGAVAAAAAAQGTIDIVAEANQGGKMVKAVLHTADPRLRVKLVNAHTGKTVRAEPVSHLFEAGRAFLHGRMPELEAQLLGMIAGGAYEGPGNSPDRADAMVWGLTELMPVAQPVPRVRGL